MSRLARYAAVLLSFMLGMTLALATEAQELAPDFVLKSSHGENYRLSEHRGTVVVLSFWASWCMPCRNSVPPLAALRAKLPVDDVTIFAISLDGNTERAGAMANAWELGLPVLFDDDQSVIKSFGMSNVPSAVLIDRDGRVRHVEENSDLLLALDYRHRLKELIEE